MRFTLLKVNFLRHHIVENKSNFYQVNRAHLHVLAQTKIEEKEFIVIRENESLEARVLSLFVFIRVSMCIETFR